jgi:hypothetical protein
MTTLAAIAHATTLTVTSGGAGFNQNTGSVAFSGDGFSVSIIDSFGMPQLAFPFFPFVPVVGMSFSQYPARFGSVQVGSESCSLSAGVPQDFSCGFVTFTGSAPLTGFGATAPFTASGHLNVGEGFDFVGEGVVRAGQYCATGPCTDPGLSLSWGFAAPVPEPSSLPLLATAALVVAGRLIIAHRRPTTRN